MAARDDVMQQLRRDREWPDHPARELLEARLRGLAGAQRALEQRADTNALYAVRQSLIDLAAAATDAADSLPAPIVR